MYNRQNKTKSLVEAGIIVALMIVLIMLNFYVPIFSIFGSFVLPIPIAVLYLRQDYKTTLWAILVTGIITSFINNPITGVTVTISFGIIGFLLGYCIKKQKRVSVTILFLALGFLVSTIINYSIYFAFIDKRGIIGFINENIKIMKESMEISKQIYSKAGVPQEKLQLMDEAFSFLKPEFMLNMLPAALIVSSFISAFLNYLVTRKVLIKLGYKDIKPLQTLSNIHVNVRIATIAAVGLLIGTILNRKGIPAGNYFLMSSQFILKTLLLIDGISVAIYYLRNKYKVSKGLVIFILFITVLSVLNFFYIYLGLMDVMLDFRKIDPFREYNKNKNGGL